MSHHEEDLWAVQVASGEKMLGAAQFSQVVLSSNGAMARMTTIAPQTFVGLKRIFSRSKNRDPIQRGKDALQADVVQLLLSMIT